MTVSKVMLDGEETIEIEKDVAACTKPAWMCSYLVSQQMSGRRELSLAVWAVNIRMRFGEVIVPLGKRCELVQAECTGCLTVSRVDSKVILQCLIRLEILLAAVAPK